MFNRDITNELKKWAAKPNRKPLILHGARQVGKTTAVHIFSAGFDQYIYLNLEKEEHREIFESKYPFPDLLGAMQRILSKSTAAKFMLSVKKGRGVRLVLKFQ